MCIGRDLCMLNSEKVGAPADQDSVAQLVHGASTGIVGLELGAAKEF